MIPAEFAPIASHIWQSTLFAAAAVLLTFALRRNQARVRYAILLAASYKFLIPFSWLVSLGRQFEWRTAPAALPHAVSAVTDVISAPAFLIPAADAKPVPNHLVLVPLVIGLVWVCGSLIVVAGCMREWLRLRAVVRAARPLPFALPIPVVSISSRLEPGVFGIFRPVLLLPEGIAEKLSPAQMRVVLAHELCHVRRRDNLAAAFHMLVEAIFWFHPLVWWLDGRIVEERERACDEEVIRLGSDPAAYVETILAICKSYVESPLPCLSGISGSDLKRRVVNVMANRGSEGLGQARKLMLSALAMAVIVTPIVFGIVNAPLLHAQSPGSRDQSAGTPPSFEVISVKPDPQPNLMMGNVTPSGLFRADIPTAFLIRFAYNVRDFQIVGAPSWVASKTYVVEAKVDDSVVQKLATMSSDERTAETRLLLQSLLTQRFGLKIHHEIKDVSSFDLVVTKPGRLRESQVDCKSQPQAATVPPSRRVWPSPSCSAINYPGHIAGLAMPVSKLASFLTFDLRQTVTDKTGVSGNYDLILDWVPDPSQTQPLQPGTTVPPPDPNGASLQAALKDQLGLKLVSVKTPLDSIVIDHIEEPTPN